MSDTPATDVGDDDDELTVGDEVWRRQIMKCFVDQHRQLEVDTLAFRKPLELSEHRRNVIALPGRPPADCRIFAPTI